MVLKRTFAAWWGAGDLAAGDLKPVVSADNPQKLIAGGGNLFFKTPDYSAWRFRKEIAGVHSGTYGPDRLLRRNTTPFYPPILGADAL